MKVYLTTFSILTILFVTSCTRYITPPVTGQNNIGYIPRPFYQDSSSSKIYISGGYQTATSTNGHLNFYMGNLNISRGHSFKNINFGYGLFGSFGKAVYKDSITKTNNYPNSKPIANFNKNLNNIGIRTTLGYHAISDNGKTTFRFINWESAFSIENGDYADYRSDLYKSNISDSPVRIYVTNQRNFLTTGLSTEVIKREAFDIKDLEISFRFFFGNTFNFNNSYRNIGRGSSEINKKGGCVVASYFVKYKKIFTSIELGTDVNYGAKLLLGYRF